MIDHLKLQSSGDQPMRTASGEIVVMPKFEVSITIPMNVPDPIIYPPRHDISSTQFGGNRSYDVLLGMDILRKCHFTMGNEQFTLST